MSTTIYSILFFLWKNWKKWRLITDFCGAVNIFYVENSTQTVEDDFGKSWNQLSRRHEYIDAIRPWLE